LSQSFTDFEFIIVDDASSDDTPKILANYAKRDNRIKIITHEINQKQTAAANTACLNTIGKYIVRMDSDDVALSDRLKQQVAFMETYSDCGILGSWANCIDNNGKPFGIYKTKTSHQHLCWRLLFEPSFISSSMMMRKETVEQLGFYQTIQAEDYDLWSRVSTIANIANLPLVLQQRRVWDGQVYHSVKKETHDCTVQIMKNNMQLLLNNSNIDFETVRTIRIVFENEKRIFKRDLILDAISLIIKLYNKFMEKTDLNKNERKSIDVDVFQMLNRLTKWLFSVDILHALSNTIYLMIYFPKLYLYSLYLRIKKVNVLLAHVWS
jgi:glycosyltransferase involved in cell wall biosynthesis